MTTTPESTSQIATERDEEIWRIAASPITRRMATELPDEAFGDTTHDLIASGLAAAAHHEWTRRNNASATPIDPPASPDTVYRALHLVAASTE